MQEPLAPIFNEIDVNGIGFQQKFKLKKQPNSNTNATSSLDIQNKFYVNTNLLYYWRT